MKKRLLAGVLAAVMAVMMTPGRLPEKADAAVLLRNPSVVSNSSMTSGQKVTYDCVWFGSYPQTEIVDKASTCGSYGKTWADTSDYEENSSLYASLVKATNWDSYGDTVISGRKYRRLKVEETTYSSFYASPDDSEYDNYYTWASEGSYHYFRYEPIKWRVLNIDNNSAFLLADKGLDTQKYNAADTNTSWKTSTIRSWLNGYGASVNNCSTDYTNKNFINSAFTASDRNAINLTYLNNHTTGPYSESAGEEDTKDKVFLLSSYDMYDSDNSASFGFHKADKDNYDEARRSKTGTYAKAMGAYSDTSSEFTGSCYWWLRSRDDNADYAARVSYHGRVLTYGYLVNLFTHAVRPALNLNLSSTDLYTYAGTVCTDGTEREEGLEEAVSKIVIVPSNPTVKKSQSIIAVNKTIAINNKPISLGAKSSGKGKLTYSSSTPSVATVSTSGAITPKNYGTTTITIKAAETSTYKAASKRVTVTVVPKKMKLSSVKSPSKKTLVIKWAKDTAATKYEIQLCMKQDFKKNTLSRTYGKKVVKQKIKNMKSKNWYVRIRAWKKVGGKTYYGIWSDVKKVKVR